MSADEDTMPGNDPPPAVPPTAEPTLSELGERIATLSDAVFSPDGKVSQILKSSASANEKLDHIIGLLKTIADESQEHNKRIATLEGARKRHSGLLARVVPPELVEALDGTNGSGAPPPAE